VEDINLCRKVVLQHRDYRLRRVLRASSIRGLLRSASEYVIEAISRRHFNKVAVCSFLKYEDDSRKPGMPLCKLPLNPSEDRKLVEYLESIGWLERSGGVTKYYNYPCLACSLFGALGIKSPLVVALQENSGREAFSVEIKDAKITKHRFVHEIRKRISSPLILESIPSGCEFTVIISIGRGPCEKLYVRKESFERVATAALWLAVQVINAGFFRLGRFKSRGMGRIYMYPSKESLNVLCEILNCRRNTNVWNELTRKSASFIKTELGARLRE